MVKRIARACLLLLPVALAAEEGRTRVRVGVGYSVPWAYQGPDGTPTGFYVEAMKEAARREGVAFEIVFRRDGPERSLRAGEVDIWSAAVPTSERRKRLYFTEFWWAQDHYLAVLGSGPIQGMGDLQGRSVVHGTSPPFTADLRAVLPGAVLRPVEALRSRFEEFCAGRADAVLFYHETSLFAVTGSNELAACRERGLRLIPVGRPIMEVAIAALPENRALADRFRERLRQMERDQTLTRIASFPLTGNESLTKLLQAKQSEHNDRLLELSLLFVSLLLLLSGGAYIRLRRANQRTQEALALAEKALRVKSQFLATMSHEIRTPLTAISGYVDMLMGTPLRHDQRRFASEVAQAAESLLTLMTALLGYARSGATFASTPDETLDPSAVIDDCLAAVLLEAESRGLELTVEMDSALPRRLRGDAVRLRQSVLNLLNNAVKFTPEGWVRLHASYSGGYLVCVVSDSGVGIPADKRQDIFEPFTQLDSSDTRRFGGVGLGLAVVADICKQLGGTVEVDDAAGGGAQFTLRLPYGSIPGEAAWLPAGTGGAAAILARPGRAIEVLGGYLAQAGLPVTNFSTAEALRAWHPPGAGRLLCFVDDEAFGEVTPVWRNSRTTVILMARMGYLREVSEEQKVRYDDVLPLPATARSVREILQPSDRSVNELVPIGMYVLVVDDNAVNRRVLTSLLEKLGCRVDTARNGTEAVTAVANEQYGIVLMDCQMPVMNGYQATEEIRRLGAGGVEVPICGVSASIDTDTRQRCEASGMNEFIPKPVTLAALRDLLRRVTTQTVSR